MVTDINSNVKLHKQLSTSEKLINTGVITHLLFHATLSLGTLIDDMISKVEFGLQILRCAYYSLTL